MAYLLALVSAVFYGAADFVGGLTARRTNTLAAVLISQFAGLVLLAAMMPVLPPATPASSDFVWGMLAGLAGGTGVAFLYRALAVGTMAVVAPITAVCAVAIPVVVSAAVFGEHVGTQTAAGIALAMVAITLVSQQPADAAASGPRSTGLLPPGIREALLSGVAIGLFFLALARTGASAGMWPLVAARVASVGFFAIVAAMRRTPLRMSAPAFALACGGGALDMLANAVYLAATRRGALSGVVTLASLYPASTIVLARIVLGERLSRLQAAGIVSALAATVVIVSA